MEKTCIQCRCGFSKGDTESNPVWDKRRFCSRGCWYAWKSSQPTKQARIPCRICGSPTNYLASVKDHIGLVHCSMEKCREEYRRRKNEAIRATHLSDYASGKRAKVRDAW